jgi:uncharacterized phiE125 gp8 family phage protein
MRFSLTQTTAPVDEPLTVAEAKLWLRIDNDAEDPVIADMVQAARESCEVFTQRQFLTATFRMKLDAFPLNDAPLQLPRPPLQSVTSVTYLDTGGVSTVMPSTDYTVDTDTEPGRIVLNYGKTWPSTRLIEQSVTVVFLAGWTTPQLVPMSIKRAVAAQAGTLYGMRETISDRPVHKVVEAAESLLWQQRVWYEAA